jgi:hypothetical protein
MRRSRRRPVPLDLIALWGGLFALFVVIAVYVAQMDECAAADITANASHALPTEDLPEPIRQTVITRYNQRFCTCGCLMTVPSCLKNHKSCRTSKRISLEILQSVHSEIQSAHSHP